MIRAAALLAAVAVVLAACGWGGDLPSPRPHVVSPSAGGRHERFTVALTSKHATGLVGKAQHHYVAEAHAVQPAVACVNNRDRVFAPRPAGARLTATLDPARGEGGPEGWCPGLFRGTVTYTEAFACPAKGTCHPPRDFPERTQVVARFTFRVR